MCEIQFDGFVFPAFDQITTQLAKQTFRHEGALQLPVVIRIPYGGHIGAVEHHQESPEAYFTHTPGSPGRESVDAERRVLDDPGRDRLARPGHLPRAQGQVLDEGRGRHVGRALPLHASRIVRRGTDVTLVGHGAMVSTLLQAAALAESEGTSCEVVDVRSLSPVDYGPILDSVRRTGRMVYAQEAPGFVSLGSEIAATVMERAFYALEAPVLRVSGFDTPFPPAKLEGAFLPDADRILEAVDRSLAY